MRQTSTKLASAITFIGALLIFPSVLTSCNRAPERGQKSSVTRTPATNERTGAQQCTEQEINSPEALQGFDDRTNCLTAQDVHLKDLERFDVVEKEDDGLGPVYNAQSCRECHQNPRSGAASQIHEFRAGHLERNRKNQPVFVDADVPINNGNNRITDRNLINDRAICPEVQELVPDRENVRTNRLSLNVLGDGYVEAVDDATLIARGKEQCAKPKAKICGQYILVPILEQSPANGTPVVRVGRFGWKDQHASLLSFAADAYLNEMGITNGVLPDEVTFVCNKAKEPNDAPSDDDDIHHFARFMRATRVPPPNIPPADSEALRRYTNGSNQFDAAGCGTCHVREMTTSSNDITFKNHVFPVDPALRNRRFRPLSDFLLHNIGTGDGIVISVKEHYGDERGLRMLGVDATNIARARQGVRSTFTLAANAQRVPAVADRSGCVKVEVDASRSARLNDTDELTVPGLDRYAALHARMQCFANFLRTPPLWGIRVRSKLMHDGGSVTVRDAIRRHGGEAEDSRRFFDRFKKAAQDDLVFFVASQ